MASGCMSPDSPHHHTVPTIPVTSNMGCSPSPWSPSVRYTSIPNQTAESQWDDKKLHQKRSPGKSKLKYSIVSHFAEIGKGEPAILREYKGSSMADGSLHSDTVKQIDSQEAQGYPAMMESAAEQRQWRKEQGLDGAP